MKNTTIILTATILLLNSVMSAATVSGLKLVYKQYDSTTKWRGMTYRGDYNSIPSNLEIMGMFVEGSLSAGDSVKAIWKRGNEIVGTTNVQSPTNVPSANLSHASSTPIHRSATVNFRPGKYTVEIYANDMLIKTLGFAIK